MKQSYIVAAGDTVSQLINAWVFNSGNSNQSLSGRCWIQRNRWFWGKLRITIDWIALTVFRNSDHCYEAYHKDRLRGALEAGLTKEVWYELLESGKISPL
jgi:hypothetical protein